jgi:opacity protein-like surface antigen
MIRSTIHASRTKAASGLASAGLALALLLGFTATSAVAADMGGPEPAFAAPQKPELVELGTGWYIRGDTSYTRYINPQVSYSNIQYLRESIDSGWTAGGGFGYKFLNWLRADVTLDYRFPAAFKARTEVPGFFSEERAKINSYALLANAYVDLGTWSGLTPYIGAGIGGGGSRAESYVGTNYTAAGVLVNQRAFFAKERNTLAWALMGGVAVEVGHGFSLDFGYRYLSLGDYRSQVDVLGRDVRFKDNKTHEVRVGLRYMID